MRATKALAIVSLAVMAMGQDEDPLEALANNIPGVPGQDYPIFAFPPDTSLLCDGKTEGYYADPEADCQAFHICADDSTDGKIKYSFLCPNGTLFNQQYFICDWWFNVDCSLAEDFYGLNDDVKAAGEAASARLEAERNGRDFPDSQDFPGLEGRRNQG